MQEPAQHPAHAVAPATERLTLVDCLAQTGVPKLHCSKLLPLEPFDDCQN